MQIRLLFFNYEKKECQKTSLVCIQRVVDGEILCLNFTFAVLHSVKSDLTDCNQKLALADNVSH